MEITSKFVKKLEDKCVNAQKSIILCESTDPRILEAVKHISDRNSAREIYLTGYPDDIVEAARDLGFWDRAVENKVKFVDKVWPDIQQQLAVFYKGKMDKKQRTYTQEKLEAFISHPLNQSAFLVADKKIDSSLAGCVYTTAEVIRAAIFSIGLKSDIKIISGSFVLSRNSSASDQTYLYSDCGVVIDPSVENLVDIAASGAQTWSSLMDTPPVVAFLSFSTMGSAKHQRSEKMRKAAALFKEKYPEIDSDGEMQFDAAFSEEIGKKKMPDSTVPGRANCFIFPDLDAGNIAYKITQRLGGFDAFGPILEGTAYPFCDLSRGSTVMDIIPCAYISMLRA